MNIERIFQLSDLIDRKSQYFVSAFREDESWDLPQRALISFLDVAYNDPRFGWNFATSFIGSSRNIGDCGIYEIWIWRAYHHAADLVCDEVIKAALAIDQSHCRIKANILRSVLVDCLRANKGRLGDLGGGNHFLDALAPYDNGPLHFLIHTGSRSESGHVDQFIDNPAEFDREFQRVVLWASDNRARIHKEIEGVFGKTEMILDLPHNTYEILPGGGTVIRKGSVRLEPGELSVIPSHISGDVVTIRATAKVDEILCSMSHGTGRKMSRGDCKPLADIFDFAALRRSVLVPSRVEDASLRTEGPYAYRDLEEGLALIKGYVEEVARFVVIGYMGHL